MTHPSDRRHRDKSRQKNLNEANRGLWMKHPQKSQRKEGSPVRSQSVHPWQVFFCVAHRSSSRGREARLKWQLISHWPIKSNTETNASWPLGRPQNTGERSKNGKAPQQSVTIALSLITTDGKLQIRLLKLRWAVERKARHDGLRNRTRHRTSDWARNSFPNWSRLKPTGYRSSIQEQKRVGYIQLFFLGQFYGRRIKIMTYISLQLHYYNP